MDEKEIFCQQRTLPSQTPIMNHYAQSSYNTRERYYSYVEQIVETMRLAPQRVVEVGIGSSFFTRALRNYGVEVLTADYDANLRPDVVADVTALPFRAECADVSVCFQVLEHLPFDRFAQGLSELARVSREWVFFSVPDMRSALRFNVGRGLNLQQTKQKLWSGFPPRRPRPHVYDGVHYWEIGKMGTSEAQILKTIAECGLETVRHYRLYLHPYHHFFLLRKQTRTTQ